MKTVTHEFTFYEVGDILDVAQVKPKHHKNTLLKAKRMLIVSIRKVYDGRFHYKGVTDNGAMTTITADELGDEKYIGHIDLADLLGK